MILSLAHAPVDAASRDNLVGAWSDLVVGERPDGLVDAGMRRSTGQNMGRYMESAARFGFRRNESSGGNGRPF